jgi:hypothetical protein
MPEQSVLAYTRSAQILPADSGRWRFHACRQIWRSSECLLYRFVPYENLFGAKVFKRKNMRQDGVDRGLRREKQDGVGPGFTLIRLAIRHTRLLELTIICSGYYLLQKNEDIFVEGFGAWKGIFLRRKHKFPLDFLFPKFKRT